GKAVMFRHATERYKPLLAQAKTDEELLLLEHATFGVSHDTLGAALCESWGVAPQAVDSVRYHVIVNATLELPMHVPRRQLCASRRSFSAGETSAFADSCCTRLTMSAGVPAGASRPNHELAS